MNALDRPNGLRILIVEDSADVADSQALLLKLYGHQVLTASNGPDALTLSFAAPVDVVLLDLELPGMSGCDVARRIKEARLQKTPLLIAVTGYGRYEDRLRSAEAGIDLHLVKPVEPEMLHCILGKFHKLIDEQSVEKEVPSMPLTVTRFPPRRE